MVKVHKHFPAQGLMALALASATALSGCSAPPALKTSQAEIAHSWSGRLGLQVHDPLAQEQSFSASFHLQGTPQQGRLDIFNPLGSQIARATVAAWTSTHCSKVIASPHPTRTARTCDKVWGTVLPTRGAIWLAAGPGCDSRWLAG